MKKHKNALIILLISIILVILSNVILRVDPSPIEAYQQRAVIVLSLWSFSIIPCYMFIYRYYISKERSYLEVRIIMELIFLPFLIAPFFMVKYYISEFRKD